MDRFGRFTDGARKVLTCAQEEATRLNHNYIGTEHLLVALARVDDVGGHALHGVGLTVDCLRAAVETTVGRGAHPIRGEIGLAPPAKAAIEAAVQDAQQAGHHHVGTEHLLLALLGDDAGKARAILASLDVTPDALRERLAALSAAGGQGITNGEPAGRMAAESVPSTRFDKFTARARKVLTLAQEEATRFNHNYIGAEHLLLGLVREGDGVAAKVLTGLGVELNQVRSAVEFIIGRGDRMIVGEIGLTPRAKEVIELAVDEARRLGHHYIGTEHLLLGLVREGEGIAAGVLESLGVNLEKVRTQTIQILSKGVTPAPASDPGAAPARHAIQWEYLELEVGPAGATGERFVARALGHEDVSFAAGASLYEALRLLGRQGWELVAIDRAPGEPNARYVFKRSLAAQGE